MANLTYMQGKPALLRHLSLWICNTSQCLWADLVSERLILLFFAELSPVFTHQQPSVLPPFQYHPPVCCPGISPARPGLHGLVKGTTAASDDPSSAELTLGSGNCRAGEVRKAHKASEGTFFACQKATMKSAQRAKLSQPYLPVSENNRPIVLYPFYFVQVRNCFINCVPFFLFPSFFTFYFSFLFFCFFFLLFFPVDTSFEGQVERGCPISCVLVSLRSAKL